MCTLSDPGKKKCDGKDKGAPLLLQNRLNERWTLICFEVIIKNGILFKVTHSLASTLVSVTTTCRNFLPTFCLMKWTPGLRTLLQLTMIQQSVRRIQMRSLSTDRCAFINILCGQKWEQSIIDLISDMGKRRVQVWRWGRGRSSEGNCTIGSGNRSFTVRLQAEDASLHGVTDLPPARAHHEILLWFGQAGGAHTERSLHRDRGIQHDGK